MFDLDKSGRQYGLLADLQALRNTLEIARSMPTCATEDDLVVVDRAIEYMQEEIKESWEKLKKI